MGLFKKKSIVKSYDKENKRPVIKASICNGEQVAGFKDIHTGKIEEVMLIRSRADLENFKAMYGINSQSYLEVYLNTSNKVNSKYDNIPTSSQLLVQIPLSQKAIEINLKTQEVNKSIEKNITNYSFDIGQWAKMAVIKRI